MESEQELKMWVAIRTDLKMSVGKIAAQVGHAFMSLGFDNCNSEIIEQYMKEGATPKITVQVSSEIGLRRVRAESGEAGIWSFMVVDAGRSEVEAGSPTVCVFGPCRRSDLPVYLKRLRLYDQKA